MLALLQLLACKTPVAPPGDTHTSGDDTGSSYDVSTCTQDDCGGGDSGTPSTLEVTWDGDHASFKESSLRATCCVTLKLHHTVEGHSMAFSFEETGTPCDCMCSYNLAWTVAGLESGHWDFTAQGAFGGADSAGIEVP